MPDRAGYQVSVYALDVSPSMGEEVDDVGSSSKGSSGRKTKLSLAKEYIARQCEPKITSGRKTEAVGILSFGGKTNNQANRAYVQTNPDDEDPAYAAVACDVAIQTAKPKMLEAVMNLDPGEAEGNPVSALMVALDMIHTHKHTKSWALEVVLITDGESSFRQDEYEDAMARFDDLGVKLSVIGIGFDRPEVPIDKANKSRNKRLAAKFWRTFVTMLHERVSQTTSAEEMLPIFGTFEDALILARLPRPAVVNGTVSGIELRIGSAEIDENQAIVIPIKYSKATMKARPPSLSKAWKAAMDLQAPTRNDGYRDQNASQLMVSLTQQSQSNGGGEKRIDPSELAAMISAEVKQHSTYVLKRTEPEKAKEIAVRATQASQRGETEEERDPDFVDPESGLPAAQDAEAEEEVDDEFVAKEDIVKAWRFGSTWVPMEADTFEPLNSQKGVEVLHFIPTANIKRHHLMGEVRFVWPDLTAPKAQIQFSSLVEGMKLREVSAVVRWVLKDQAEPSIGICVPMMDFPGDDKRLDYMFWIKLPFAEDEHSFWFPSLTTLKTEGGKVVTQHPLLPTDEQCELMDNLVQGLDLDEYAVKAAKELREDQDDDEDMDVETPRWFEPSRSFNPVIHRIKEAIFHASLTADLNQDPLGPPHPELTRYFETPDLLAEETEKITSRLKSALDIKKVPPRQRKKYVKEGLRDDEGYIDVDALFDEPVKGESSTQTPSKQVKAEDYSQQTPETKPNVGTQPSPARPRPKKGRIISNEAPLEDFKRLIEGEGDIFRKAIQDLGAVVRDNVEASFSRSAFPLAIECLKEMRSVALMYEEVETYNEFLEGFEKAVKAKGFKHPDFWDHFEKADQAVAHITEEEAKEALEAYD